ncbi:DEAD/DEAH box helicase domain protein [alpha proteobacterium BAL199]|jgi:ATP-dependent RNA helicase RhlE|nr:DEAD/DEAH box helicase domain protein [alpha proteobacterium BAL199]
MTVQDFRSLGLAESLLRTAATCGYTTPTPIQVAAIPPLLAGRDLIGLAQTGTGKTAAFTLPMLHRLAAAGEKRIPKAPRALILTPTRELAVQIAGVVETFGRSIGLRHALVHGGVSARPQAVALQRGVEVMIATPGRLLDLINQRAVFLDKVEYFVLDEADRMLDLGFVRDVKRIAALVPANRQTALFSATMPQSIIELTESLLRNPERVQITPTSTPIERIQQSVMFVARANKRTLLARLLGAPDVSRAIVFVRTKHGVDRVVDSLRRDGLTAEGLHGNKSQGARQTALDAFKRGRLPILVATDIAARGIDVHEISHVINLDLPDVPETYIHRIGRTARAGAGGIAVSFCENEEIGNFMAIESEIRRTIDVDSTHSFHDTAIEAQYRSGRRPPVAASQRARRNNNGGGGGRPQQDAQRRGRPQGKSSSNDSNRRPRRSAEARPSA